MSDLYPLLLIPIFDERPWGARDLRPIYTRIVKEPALADWLLDDPGVDGPQVSRTPRPLVEDGDQQKWIEVGHEETLHAGEEVAHPLQSALQILVRNSVRHPDM